MTHNQKIAHELAQRIRAAGFRVFLAERGNYGIFTNEDGSRVVSFSVNLGLTNFSGNYATDKPRQTGNGWGLGMVADNFGEMLSANAPGWAVGNARVTYTTLADHLREYGPSSRYAEVTP